jgi:hypothetical protein
MIYTGLNRTGEIEQVYAHGGSEVSAVYGSIGEVEPIYYKPQTITGTSPLTFKALGQPLTNYTILGNSYQGGTPSPDNPVEVVSVGEKTENLYNGAIGVDNARYAMNTGAIAHDSRYEISELIPVLPNTDYTLSWDHVKETSRTSFMLAYYDSSGTYCVGTSDIGTYTTELHYSITVRTPSNCMFVRLQRKKQFDFNMMFNAGQEVFPYEPYGYKIPITCGGVTQNIYLDEPLRKQLNGDAADALNYATQTLTRRVDASCEPLVTPTTESVTLPQIQTISGANTLSVGTTVQPSAISITGNIKPTGYGQLLDVNDVDIQDKNNEPIFIHE